MKKIQEENLKTQAQTPLQSAKTQEKTQGKKGFKKEARSASEKNQKEGVCFA